MKMTETSQRVLAHLKTLYPQEVTKHELVEALDLSINTITGSVNGLVKKGFAEERVEEIAPTEGQKKAKSLRYVVLTTEGLAFDPVKVMEAEAVAKAEAAAMRKAGKAEA